METVLISVYATAWAASGAATILWWACRCVGRVSVGDIGWAIFGALVGPMVPACFVFCATLDWLAGHAPSGLSRAVFSCKRKSEP